MNTIVKVAVGSLYNSKKSFPAPKTVWLDSPSTPARLLTTGFTNTATRQICIWDMRKFSDAPGDPAAAALHTLDLDQGTSALYPYYDVDTKLLFLAGKGDGNVKYFELSADASDLHYISDYRSTVPQKGFDFLPKTALNVGRHEIMRGVGEGLVLREVKIFFGKLSGMIR